MTPARDYTALALFMAVNVAISAPVWSALYLMIAIAGWRASSAPRSP